VTAVSDCGPDAMPIVPTPTSRDLPGGPRRGSALSVRVLAPILAAAACTGPPCQIDRLDDLPAAAPGQVRHGLALAQGAGLSATASGVACLTCGGIYYFDPALSEQRHVAIDLLGTGELATGGDTTFVFDRDPGRGAEASGGVAQPAHYQLSALSAAGRELWRDDFGAGAAWQGAIGPELLAGPGGAVIRGEAIASVFDPATGAARWTAAIHPGDALAPDPAGGLVIASGDSQLGPATPEATLLHLDAGGTPTWAVTWTTSDTPPAVGGDVAFTALPQHGSIDGTRFVAALDAGGTTRWGAVIGTSDAAGRIDARRIAALGDAAVICGDHAGAGQLGLPATGATTDAFVARIDPTGAITAHAITGDGDQTCEALAVADDGSATIAVHSARGPGGSELRVGSQIFDDGPEKTFYVLNLVP
jgi:hypothetical protein